MKTTSIELFNLIFSLSDKEKREFSNSANKKITQPDYLLLFNAYIQNNSSDENQLKSKLKLKNFERVKHYLHKQVLQYIATNSPLNSQKELMNMIIAADALFERSLTKQALQIMYKAKKIALKKQHFNLLILINEKIHDQESSMANQKHFDYFLSEHNNTEFRNTIKILEQEQEAKVYLLKRRLFSQKNNSLMRSKESLIELKNTFKEYVKNKEKDHLTFESQRQFYITAAYYYQQLGQVSKAIHYFQKCADAFEYNNPNPSENYNNYAIALHNLMFSNARINNFEEVRKNLDKLYAIKPRTKLHRKFIMQSYVTYESLYCKYNFNYPLRKTNLKKVENYLAKYSDDVPHHLYLSTLINLSVNYFLERNFKKALEIIIKTYALESTSFFKDQLSVVKTYKLVLYYELKKTDLLTFAVRNTYRFMLKNMQYHTFEKEVMQALKKIATISSGFQQNKIWKETYERLLPLKQNPDVAQVFQLFNFTGWIHCRINQLNYNNIMNEA